MPHRRLVKIGEPPKLPTISQFLMDMASRQHDEIRRLKSEALSGTLPDPTVPEEHHEELTPDPWQLHPVRLKNPKKKTSSRKAVKATKRPKSAKNVTANAKKSAAKPKSKSKAAARGSKR